MIFDHNYSNKFGIPLTVFIVTGRISVMVDVSNIMAKDAYVYNHGVFVMENYSNIKELNKELHPYIEGLHIPFKFSKDNILDDSVYKDTLIICNSYTSAAEIIESIKNYIQKRHDELNGGNV